MRLATPFAFCLAACWYAVPGAGHDLMSNTPFRRDGYSSNNESHQVAPTTPEETSMLETARVAMASLEWPGEVMKQHKEDGLRAMHQNRDLQTTEGLFAILYSAIFIIINTQCEGFTPLLSMGCAGGGIPTIVDVTSNTGFSPQCFPIPIMGDTRIVCPVEFDQTLTDGPIVSVTVDFSCSGFIPEQLLGKAWSPTQEVQCSAGAEEAGVINVVSLNYFDFFFEVFLQDFTCQFGFFLEDEDVISSCVSVDTCPFGTSCSAVAERVQAIQNLPLPPNAAFALNPCSPCYNEDLPVADPSFLLFEGTLTCGELFVGFSAVEAGTDVCISAQAANYYLCGCPRLPPPRKIPFCSVCPSGDSPDQNQVALLDVGNTFRLITCETLDVFLGYADDFSGLYTLPTCAAYQDQDASNCGCFTTPPPQDPFCLSGDSIVRVEGKGDIPMKHLQVGDKVATSFEQGEVLRYETVYSFGHYDPKTTVEYIQLIPSMLEITKSHMVFVVGSGAIPASMVQAGDTLAASGEVVREIRTVTRKGAYAPFTPSGQIIVNGVMVSNYLSFDEASNVLVIGGVNTHLTYHWLSHLILTPQRLWCYWLGKSDSLLENGLSNWVAPLQSHVPWMLENHPWFSLASLPAVLMLLMVLRVVEYSIMYYDAWSAVVAVILFGAILGGHKGSKKRV